MRRPGPSPTSVVVGIAIATIAGLAGSPPGLADAPRTETSGTCAVQNLTQGVVYKPDDGRALTKALRDAGLKDELEVTGLCTGSYIVRQDRDVTLHGVAGEPLPVLAGTETSTLLLVARRSHLALSHVRLTGTLNSPALLNIGKTELNQVEVVDNETFGGAIENWVGTLTVNHSLIARNTFTEFGDGGGVTNSRDGHLIVRNSRITDNESDQHGGGLFSYSDDAEMTVINTKITGNSARFGGGIYNFASRLTVEGSTITHNVATEPGGGIRNVSSGARVSNSVVKQNRPDNCYGVVC